MLEIIPVESLWEGLLGFGCVLGSRSFLRWWFWSAWFGENEVEEVWQMLRIGLGGWYDDEEVLEIERFGSINTVWQADLGVNEQVWDLIHLKM